MKQLILITVVVGLLTTISSFAQNGFKCQIAGEANAYLKLLKGNGMNRLELYVPRGVSALSNAFETLVPLEDQPKEPIGSVSAIVAEYPIGRCNTRKKGFEFGCHVSQGSKIPFVPNVLFSMRTKDGFPYSVPTTVRYHDFGASYNANGKLMFDWFFKIDYKLGRELQKFNHYAQTDSLELINCKNL